MSRVSEEIANALSVAFQRYTSYLGSFGPDEVYLQKKVETELGAKMIYLKMRVSGIGSEWGKVHTHFYLRVSILDLCVIKFNVGEL